MPETLSHKNRVVLVSGAAQGIGQAIAKQFAAAGAHVHLTDRDENGLAATASALGASPHPADLSDRDAARAVVDKVVEKDGRIDCLALAAGGVRGQVGRPLEDISEEDWRAIFDANLASAMWTCQATVPVMKRNGWGRIVTISSGAGLRPSLTGIQAYAAAKHALVGLTRQLSWELGPVSYTHLRAHETKAKLVCRLLLEKKKKKTTKRRCSTHTRPITRKSHCVETAYKQPFATRPA